MTDTYKFIFDDDTTEVSARNNVSCHRLELFVARNHIDQGDYVEMNVCEHDGDDDFRRADILLSLEAAQRMAVAILMELPLETEGGLN